MNADLLQEILIVDAFIRTTLSKSATAYEILKGLRQESSVLYGAPPPHAEAA